ncbi:MAG: trypsin-like peptidase domain-containing protein [Phycisphaerales bacterium]|jgi:serine protease Do|nr:trypsin-like peptidase domain-containing protein [Phycisphaerales bacterium]
MRVLAASIAIAAAATAAIGHPHDTPIDFADSLSKAFQSAATQIKPSVVRIGTGKAATGRYRGMRPIIEGTGSGVLISEEGHIATNLHVIAGADVIVVTLHDGRRYEAEAIGADRDADLAVLHIDAVDITPATFAGDAPAHVGQWVLAVGTPFGLSHSYSAGIISATGRSNLGLSAYEHLIQTDAAINPGNSGGPLVDLHGHVVGLNTAIKTTTGASAGVGFAIPVDMVRRVTESVIADGEVAKGFIGVTLGERVDAVAGDTRCFIRAVSPGLPADEAGLRAGDTILAVGDRTVNSVSGVRHAIAVTPPGETCQLQIRREDRSYVLAVTPIARRDGVARHRP